MAVMAKLNGLLADHQRPGVALGCLDHLATLPVTWRLATAQIRHALGPCGER